MEAWIKLTVVTFLLVFAQVVRLEPVYSVNKLTESSLVYKKRSYLVKKSQEELLLDRLFKSYNSMIRPVLNSSKTVLLRVGFSLLQIQELEWEDERLRWNATEYDVSSIIVQSKLLWLPEFAAINSAEKIHENYDRFHVSVDSNGKIHWEPGGVFKTLCTVDIHYYPFDQQNCSLVFGAWSYNTKKMNMTSDTDLVNLDSYEPNGEWDVIGTIVKRQVFSFDCCQNKIFSSIKFTVNIRRRYTFYIMNVIIPSIMTSILLLSIFFCTPAQKVQIGVVVLLSFRIFLLNVTDSIPKTSDSVPLLAIYLTLTMGITTLSMVMTVIVLNMHYISDRPVPRYLYVILMHYVAPMLCMKTCRSIKISIDARKKDLKMKSKRIEKNSKSEIDHTLHCLTAQNYVNNLSISKVRKDSKLDCYVKNNAPLLSNSHSSQLLNTTFTRKKKLKKHEPPKENHVAIPINWYGIEDEVDNEFLQHQKSKHVAEWHRAAHVLDRLFFWLFFTAIIITTLILFQPLTKQYFNVINIGSDN